MVHVFDLALDLDLGGPHHVLSATITEGLSEVTRARVVVESSEVLDVEPALLRRTELTLLLDGMPARTFALVVAGVSFLGQATEGRLRYTVDLRAPLHLLGLCQDTRKFRKRSAREIVTAVLDQGAVRSVWHGMRRTPRRNYCVQYEEDNLSFVSRLLAFEGIHYRCEPDGGITLDDDTTAALPVDGQSEFELREVALASEELSIHAFSLGEEIAPGRVTVHDFDWKRPHLDLHAEARAHREVDLEVYEYPAGYRNPDDGAVIARTRLEALRAEARFADGESHAPSFTPGRRFHFGAAAGAVFEGDYVLVRVEHVLRAPAGRAKGLWYDNRFRAIPRAVPFRPPQPPSHLARPIVAGNHTAMVRGPVGEEIHTDTHGRFRAQWHWDREATGTDADSRWIRLVQESATSMHLARVGWEMVIAYVDGDPDRPIGLSRAINGVMPPSYGLPARSTVTTIKTRTSPANGGFNELRMDDAAGAMAMDIHAEKLLAAHVGNDRRESVGNDEIEFVAADETHTVGRDHRFDIGAASDVSCREGMGVVIGGGRTVTVGGSEKIDVGGSRTVEVHGSETEVVGAARLTIDGSFQLHLPNVKKKLASLKPSPDGAFSDAGSIQSAVADPSAALGGLVPSTSGLADGLTGGLASGVTADKILDITTTGGVVRGASRVLDRVAGGAVVTVSAASISAAAEGTRVEAAGGAWISLAPSGIVSSATGGSLDLSVGGAIIRSAGGDLGLSAKRRSIDAGSAVLHAVDRLELRGDTIVIEASSKLELACGSSKIVLEPAQVTMAGTVGLVTKESIAISGGMEHLT